MEKQLAELMKALGKNQKLSKLAVSESGFLFDPETGQSFTLNKTGLLTLNHLKRGATIEDTAAFLSKEYRISMESAVNSVEAFVLQLGRYL